MNIEQIVNQAQEAQNWLAYRRAAREITAAFQAGQARAPIKVRAAFLSSFTIELLIDFITVEAASIGMQLDSYVAD